MRTLRNFTGFSPRSCQNLEAAVAASPPAGTALGFCRLRQFPQSASWVGQSCTLATTRLIVGAIPKCTQISWGVHINQAPNSSPQMWKVNLTSQVTSYLALIFVECSVAQNHNLEAKVQSIFASRLTNQFKPKEKNPDLSWVVILSASVLKWIVN